VGIIGSPIKQTYWVKLKIFKVNTLPDSLHIDGTDKLYQAERNFRALDVGES